MILVLTERVWDLTEAASSPRHCGMGAEPFSRSGRLVSLFAQPCRLRISIVNRDIDRCSAKRFKDVACFAGFEPVVTVKLQDSRWMTSTGNVGFSTVWPEHLKRRRGLEANVMKGSREASFFSKAVLGDAAELGHRESLHLHRYVPQLTPFDSIWALQLTEDGPLPRSVLAYAGPGPRQWQQHESVHPMTTDAPFRCTTGAYSSGFSAAVAITGVQQLLAVLLGLCGES